MLYAIFVNVLMGVVILPMSNLPPAGPFNLANSVLGWINLGVVLGIPIAYNTYKYYGVDTKM